MGVDEERRRYGLRLCAICWTRLEIGSNRLNRLTPLCSLEGRAIAALPLYFLYSYRKGGSARGVSRSIAAGGRRRNLASNRIQNTMLEITARQVPTIATGGNVGRPRVCADMIRKGNTPSEIAQRLGISPGSVIQYLYTAVGQRLILFSDIVFSIPPEARSAIDRVIVESATDDPNLVAREVQAREIDVDPDDLTFYLRLRREVIGDLYFFMTDLEKSLHSLIEGILRREYGQEEGGW